MENKALSVLAPLVGKWEYTMYNAWFLDSMDTEIKGFTTIEWLCDSFMTLTIKADSLHTLAEASEDKGETWRKDLEMTYVKVKR